MGACCAAPDEGNLLKPVTAEDLRSVGGKPETKDITLLLKKKEPEHEGEV